jgi:two-component system C4-dicarboxylate transport sensor histidine kinase DctB
MGAITRQLKSYARKGGEAFEPVDADCVSFRAVDDGAATAPARRCASPARCPRAGDGDGRPVRLEQVMINLLRNALDATKDGRRTGDRRDAGRGRDRDVLTVRDNGTGHRGSRCLFEPFYTTKQPGDGVGLGLAISSGIVNDFGGRLTARNGRIGRRGLRDAAAALEGRDAGTADEPRNKGRHGEDARPRR